MAQQHFWNWCEEVNSIAKYQKLRQLLSDRRKTKWKRGSFMCIHISWRQPVCPWEAGPEAISCDIQIFKSIKCSSAAQVEKLRRSTGSVPPQLSGRSLCVSSCHYFPRWSIWPRGRLGIYSPWKHQTKTLELCHLLTSHSEIGICVAPSIEISLDSNT